MAGRPKKQEVQIESGLLTTREVAKKLRVDITTVRRWIDAGALEAIKLPHMRSRSVYRIKQGTLDAMLGEKGA